jgi:hypothetical protein
MIPPVQSELFSGDVLPEMLAGVSVRIEAEEDLTLRPYQAPQPAVPLAANGVTQPTPDGCGPSIRAKQGKKRRSLRFGGVEAALGSRKERPFSRQRRLYTPGPRGPDFLV